MISRNLKWLAALTLIFSACTSEGPAEDDDSGDAAPPPYVDGGASDVTRDVTGGWHWSATQVNETQPFVTCTVTVGGGTFDILCPRGGVPRPAGEGCEQLRDDLHIYGSVTVARNQSAHLEAMRDTVVQYSGGSCVGYGFTTGAAYPEPAFASVKADRIELESLGAFLSELGGTWRTIFNDTRNAAPDFECSAHLGLALEGGLGVKIAVTCLSGPMPVEGVAACVRKSEITVEAHVSPGLLDGTIDEQLQHVGTGCGPEQPLMQQGLQATMHAAPIG